MGAILLNKAVRSNSLPINFQAVPNPQNRFRSTRLGASRLWRWGRLGAFMLFIAIAVIGVTTFSKSQVSWEETSITSLLESRTDDWIEPSGFVQPEFASSYGANGAGASSHAFSGEVTHVEAMVAMADSAASMGFAVGGAKDIASFNNRIDGGMLPLPSDVTPEGLFYEHSFDLSKGDGEGSEACTSLFCPTYSLVVSPDPLANSTDKDVFVAVGLESGADAASFKRKKLNLIIALDRSGSMGSSFDGGYVPYMANNEVKPSKSKMEVATESIGNIIGHLGPSERLGMVVFDHEAEMVKPLRPIGLSDLDVLRAHINSVQPRGATDLEDALKQAFHMFKHCKTCSKDKRYFQNRVIVITDAMANSGETSDMGLLKLLKEGEKYGIGVTFVGVGLDFDSRLVNAISRVRGANYYAVHSAKDFMRRMDDEFEFMVSPLVYDLSVAIHESSRHDWNITKVYGSPEEGLTTGEAMHVKTLFPSMTSEEGTRGGVILLRLSYIGKRWHDMKLRMRTTSLFVANPLTLVTKYEDAITGEKTKAKAVVDVAKAAKSVVSYDSAGARKAVFLARFVDLLRLWLLDEREPKYELIPMPYFWNQTFYMNTSIPEDPSNPDGPFEGQVSVQVDPMPAQADPGAAQVDPSWGKKDSNWVQVDSFPAQDERMPTVFRCGVGMPIVPPSIEDVDPMRWMYISSMPPLTVSPHHLAAFEMFLQHAISEAQALPAPGEDKEHARALGEDALSKAGHFDGATGQMVGTENIPLESFSSAIGSEIALLTRLIGVGRTGGVITYDKPMIIPNDYVDKPACAASHDVATGITTTHCGGMGESVSSAGDAGSSGYTAGFDPGRDVAEAADGEAVGGEMPDTEDTQDGASDDNGDVETMQDGVARSDAATDLPAHGWARAGNFRARQMHIRG